MTTNQPTPPNSDMNSGEIEQLLVRAALVAEVAKTATDPGGQAWIPLQMTMEDEDDDWRPF